MKRVRETMEPFVEKFQSGKPRERLLALADHLDGLKTGKRAGLAFDMNTVAGTILENDARPVWNGPRMISDFCGTVCCAIGSMPLGEYFQRDGFEFRQGKSGLPNGVLREGKYFDFIESSRGYFGISIETAYWLFTMDGYKVAPTPKQVADRIRRLVEVGLTEMENDHA